MHRLYRGAGTYRRRSSPEILENAKHRIAGLLIEVILAQSAGDADRLPDLLQVDRAGRAERDVLLEPEPPLGRHASVEVVGNQLDQILADDLGFGHVSSPGCRFGRSRRAVLIAPDAAAPAGWSLKAQGHCKLLRPTNPRCPVG